MTWLTVIEAVMFIGFAAMGLGFGYYFGIRDGLQSGYSSGWSDAMQEVRRIIARTKEAS